MKVSLHQTGCVGRAVIALGLGLCGSTQAGMQLQSQPAEPAPKAAPAPASATSKPRTATGPAPSPTTRPDERVAWSPCLRLVNAAALGASIDAERRQALLEHCGTETLTGSVP